MSARKLKAIERSARAEFEAAAAEWSNNPCDATDKAAAAAYSVWLKAEREWLEAQAREWEAKRNNRPFDYSFSVDLHTRKA